MKKLYLLLLLLSFSATNLAAQGLSRAWWGAHGGVNFSNLSSSSYSTDYLTGYNVGVSYSHPIAKFLPAFVQSGVYFSRQGARDHGFLAESGEDSSLVTHQLEIPLMLGYLAPINSRWSIESLVGFFYSVALGGEFKMGDEQFDPYRTELLQTLRDSAPTDQQLLHRSNFGVRVGVSALYRRWLLGFSYNSSLTNLYTADLRDAGYQAHSGVFSIRTGVIF